MFNGALTVGKIFHFLHIEMYSGEHIIAPLNCLSVFIRSITNLNAYIFPIFKERELRCHRSAPSSEITTTNLTPPTMPFHSRVNGMSLIRTTTTGRPHQPDPMLTITPSAAAAPSRIRHCHGHLHLRAPSTRPLPRCAM